MKDYISSRLDTDLINPDNGANVARKRARLVANGHLPHDRVPKPPSNGWVDSLANLPSVSFSSIYQHFVERSVRAALGMLSDSDIADSESMESYRAVSKGYLFFKDDHVQKLKYHPMPEHDGVCYVKATVLPSMVKSKMYTVHLCLSSDWTVLSASCVCIAGLAGGCNHVAGSLYALEDFVRSAMREEANLPCTSKLQKWNQPCRRKVQPSCAMDACFIKEEFGKAKRAQRHHLYDPCLLSHVVPGP